MFFGLAPAWKPGFLMRKSRVSFFRQMLKLLGESQFEIIWPKVTGENCAGDLRE
ncbi:hypothetical protein [Scytonema sp. NUACC21]